MGVMVLAAVLGVIGVIGIFAARLRGAPGSVALGALAGLAFGAAAIDSRSLANTHNWHGFLTHPLLYLLFAHALVGQLLLGIQSCTDLPRTTEGVRRATPARPPSRHWCRGRGAR